MCDNVNLVFDREHGERFERQIGRRGVYFTMEQVRDYVEPAVGIRGWDYHWPSQSMNPAIRLAPAPRPRHAAATATRSIIAVSGVATTVR